MYRIIMIYVSVSECVTLCVLHVCTKLHSQKYCHTFNYHNRFWFIASISVCFISQHGHEYMHIVWKGKLDSYCT